MKLLTRIENVKKLWGLLLPSIPVPPDETVAKWVKFSGDDLIEATVIRTSVKFKTTPLKEPDGAYKYCSSILRNKSQDLTEEMRQMSPNSLACY